MGNIKTFNAAERAALVALRELHSQSFITDKQYSFEKLEMDEAMQVGDGKRSWHIRCITFTQGGGNHPVKIQVRTESWDDGSGEPSQYSWRPTFAEITPPGCVPFRAERLREPVAHWFSLGSIQSNGVLTSLPREVVQQVNQ